MLERVLRKMEIVQFHSYSRQLDYIDFKITVVFWYTKAKQKWLQIKEKLLHTQKQTLHNLHRQSVNSGVGGDNLSIIEIPFCSKTLFG